MRRVDQDRATARGPHDSVDALWPPVRRRRGSPTLCRTEDHRWPLGNHDDDLYVGRSLSALMQFGRGRAPFVNRHIH